MSVGGGISVSVGVGGGVSVGACVLVGCGVIVGCGVLVGWGTGVRLGGNVSGGALVGLGIETVGGIRVAVLNTGGGTNWNGVGCSGLVKVLVAPMPKVGWSVAVVVLSSGIGVNVAVAGCKVVSLALGAVPHRTNPMQ